MEDLIRQISQKLRVSEEQAKTAVETVVGYLKEKMPGEFSNKLENLVASAGEKLDTFAKNVDKMAGEAGQKGEAFAKDVAQKGAEASKGASKTADDVVKGLGKAADDVVKGLGSLFGKGEDDKKG